MVSIMIHIAPNVTNAVLSLSEYLIQYIILPGSCFLMLTCLNMPKQVLAKKLKCLETNTFKIKIVNIGVLVQNMKKNCVVGGWQP